MTSYKKCYFDEIYKNDKLIVANTTLRNALKDVRSLIISALNPEWTADAEVEILQQALDKCNEVI